MYFYYAKTRTISHFPVCITGKILVKSGDFLVLTPKHDKQTSKYYNDVLLVWDENDISRTVWLARMFCHQETQIIFAKDCSPSLSFTTYSHCHFRATISPVATPKNFSRDITVSAEIDTISRFGDIFFKEAPREVCNDSFFRSSCGPRIQLGLRFGGK